MVEEKLRRAVFPGRFQPPHYGHLRSIKWALERVEELVIVIGSAQESHTLVNPFTAGERMLMVKSMLREEGVDLSRIYIVPVADIAMNAVWVTYLSMLIPPIDAVVSRNPLVLRLFREAGYRLLVPPAFEREQLMATKIRDLMLRGNDWTRYVPPSVARIVEEIRGAERIREIALRD